MTQVPYQLQYRNKLRKLILEVYNEFDKLVETKRPRKLENYYAQLDAAEKELIMINYKFDFTDNDYELTKQYFDKLVILKESIESILMTNNYITSIRHYDLSKSSLSNFTSQTNDEIISTSSNTVANVDNKSQPTSVVNLAIATTADDQANSSYFYQTLSSALNAKEEPDWSLFWILFDYYFNNSNFDPDNGDNLTQLLDSMPTDIKQKMNSYLFKMAVDYLQKNYPPANGTKCSSSDLLCQTNNDEDNHFPSLSLSNDDSSSDDDDHVEFRLENGTQVSENQSLLLGELFQHTENEFTFCNSTSKSTEFNSATKNGILIKSADLLEQTNSASPILDISWTKVKCLSKMNDSQSTVSDVNEINEPFAECNLHCSSPFQQIECTNGGNHFSNNNSNTKKELNSLQSPELIHVGDQQSNQQTSLSKTFDKKVGIYGKKINDENSRCVAQSATTQTDQDKLDNMLHNFETNCRKQSTLSKLFEWQKNYLNNNGNSSLDKLEQPSSSGVALSSKDHSQSDQTAQHSTIDLSPETLKQLSPNLDSKLSTSIVKNGKTNKNKKKRYDYQRKCVLCNVKWHKTENCDQFNTISALKTRVKILKRCYRCLSTEHKTKKCKEPVGCSKCSGRHITVLCRNENLR